MVAKFTKPIAKRGWNALLELEGTVAVMHVKLTNIVEDRNVLQLFIHKSQSTVLAGEYCHFKYS